MALMGTVKTISASQIVVADPRGKETTFAVSDKTPIMGKDQKPGMLTKLTTGEGVVVNYKVVNGVNEATASKVKS